MVPGINQGPRSRVSQELSATDKRTSPMSPATLTDEEQVIAAFPASGHGSLRVREASSSDEPRWAEFVDAHPGAMIYHHPAWVAALQEEYGRKSSTLICEDGEGRLRGVLSLLETRGLPFNWNGNATGRRLASLPRTPLAGPLALDQEAAAELLNAASRRVSAHPGRQLQVKSLDDSLSTHIPALAMAPWKDIYVLDLPPHPSELSWGSKEKRHRIRWAVNRAIKSGVEVREAGSESDLRAWYQLYLETMRWHGSLPRPYRFLQSLWNRLRPLGRMTLLLAEHCQPPEQAPVLLAGYLLLMCGQTMHCYLNGRRRDSLALHPNDLLQWHAIHEACRLGFRSYDFGEVEAGQRGLAEFKTKWGAKPVPSFRYYYPATRRLPAQSASPGLAYSLATRMWRYMPLPATAAVGDWLYSYL